MIETVKNSPEHMRRAVYDLARYKFQGQFTHADAKDVRRTREALETAIRGVEHFSKQQFSIPAPSPVPQCGTGTAAFDPPPPEPARQRSPGAWNSIEHRLALEKRPPAFGRSRKKRPRCSRSSLQSLPHFNQRERMASLLQNLPKYEQQARLSRQRRRSRPSAAAARKAKSAAADGLWHLRDQQWSLTELQLLPGRPPDIRIAVSAARCCRTGNRNSSCSVAMSPPTSGSRRGPHLAKVAREFSAEAAGKKLDESDETWVIRNLSFPFRAVSGARQSRDVRTPQRGSRA